MFVLMLWMLVLSVSADAQDDYCRTSDSIAMGCMKRFCMAIRAEFGAHHLRQPIRANFDQQLAIIALHEFHSIFALLDCMNYE